MAEARVLHVAQPVDGGVAVVVHALAVAQRSAGRAAVAIACPPEGPLAAWARDSGVEVLAWPAVRSPVRGVWRETRTLGAHLRAWRPDLVHLHSAKAGLVGRLAIHGTRPTIFQPHAWSFDAVDGPAASAVRAWERFALRWTDRVIAVSADEAAQTPGRPPVGRVVVVHNGVDPTRFSPVDDATRRSLRAARVPELRGPLVLCVGRLCRQKGQDLLLDAWPAVLGRVPDASLVLVGDGPEEQALTARAGPRVHFVGARRDVAAWLACADLVVAPSRWEGQSLALLEAMASGAPIVATAVAGVREALGEVGTIVPVEDPGALAEALADALLDEPARRRAGEAVRARALAGFTFARTVGAIDEVYEAVRERV